MRAMGECACKTLISSNPYNSRMNGNMKALFFLSFFVSIIGNLLAHYLTFYIIVNNIGYEVNTFQSVLMLHSFLIATMVSLLVIGFIYCLIYYLKIIDNKNVIFLYLLFNLLIWYDFLEDYFVFKYGISVPFDISVVYLVVSVMLFVIGSIVISMKTYKKGFTEVEI